MPIPDFQSLMLPVLRLSNEGEIRLAAAVRRLSEDLGITEEEQEEMTPSRLQSKIKNRVSWAVTYLVWYGLVVRPKHGYFKICSMGKEVLSNPPDRIDVAYLKRIFTNMLLLVLRLTNERETNKVDAANRILELCELPDQEREEILPNNGQRNIETRIDWAVSCLERYGLVEFSQDGNFRISSMGKEVLANPPRRIDIPFLKGISGVDQRAANSNDDNSIRDRSNDDLEAGTPEERAVAAVEEMNSALREELLERIRVMDPSAFEDLIIKLMTKMGYGDEESNMRIGGAGDGGIDGIINEDPLGLNIIYLQAKRYTTSSIGPDKIREFIGALEGKRATKGVIVTTSRYTAEAVNCARDSQKRLKLIDGDLLTQLMVKYDVAVRGHNTLELKKIDTDYFGGNDE